MFIFIVVLQTRERVQVPLRVLSCLRGVSPRRAFPWGSTSRTHLCLRFKFKRIQGSRRPPRSHLRRLSLPSLSQTLRLISALLGFLSLKSSLNSRNRILRLRYMTCPFHPLKLKPARLHHFRSHPLALLLLQRRLIWGKRLRMCISTVCPLISRKISCSRSPVRLVRFVVCGRLLGTLGIVRVDMGSFCLRRSTLLRGASSL